jgi:glucan phosphoethanolaminetransferase (alkaline phosphatase superfamily)
MLLLAVSALEKAQSLKPEVWLKIGIAIAVFVAVILIYRRLMKVNKVVAGVVIFVVFTVVFFSWVYNRNEPKFLTPVVEKIAPFFPSAGSYQTKQKTTPKP